MIISVLGLKPNYTEITKEFLWKTEAEKKKQNWKNYKTVADKSLCVLNELKFLFPNLNGN